MSMTNENINARIEFCKLESDYINDNVDEDEDIDALFDDYLSNLNRYDYIDFLERYIDTHLNEIDCDKTLKDAVLASSELDESAYIEILIDLYEKNIYSFLKKEDQNIIDAISFTKFRDSRKKVKKHFEKGENSYRTFSRDQMIDYAFALNMNLENLTWFLQNVLCDVRLNAKNAKEIIAFYAFKNFADDKYMHYIDLCKKFISLPLNKSKQTGGTDINQQLTNDLYKRRLIEITNEEELFSYLEELKFQGNGLKYSVSAQKTFIELYEKLKIELAKLYTNNEQYSKGMSEIHTNLEKFISILNELILNTAPSKELYNFEVCVNQFSVNFAKYYTLSISPKKTISDISKLYKTVIESLDEIEKNVHIVAVEHNKWQELLESIKTELNVFNKIISEKVTDEQVVDALIGENNYVDDKNRLYINRFRNVYLINFNRIDSISRGKQYATRSDIITLNFARLFINSYPGKYKDNLNRFVKSTNRYLDELGMGTLYEGNIFDSFMMMCCEMADPYICYLTFINSGIEEY